LFESFGFLVSNSQIAELTKINFRTNFAFNQSLMQNSFIPLAKITPSNNRHLISMTKSILQPVSKCQVKREFQFSATGSIKKKRL
jgi:hypothetical protein